jgi:4-amino-4-deoxy-L-arabinose transferase-like glycosyltransferase
MATTAPPSTRFRDLAVGLAAFTVLLHVVVNLVSPYEFQRDEYLYFAMGQHLRFWRMDFPPFIGVVANATRALLGDSLVALRLPSAIASGALVWLAIDVARRLGARTFGQLLAALCMLTGPLFLRAGNLYQPTVLDQLWWSLALYTLVRLGLSGQRRWWIALGVAGGLGLLTKFSILFLGFSVLVALLLTPERRALATPWPWLTLLIALALGSASIVGQVRLGFPVVGQLRDLQAVQLARVTPLDFVLGQLMLTGPAFLIAVAGVVALIRAPRFEPLRVVGWAAVAAFATLLLLHGKHYYLGPIYPVLFGVGAAVVGSAAPGWRRRVVRTTAVALPALSGLLLLPVGLPFLAPPAMEAYTEATGLAPLVNGTNTGGRLRLPQDYADALGWTDRVAAVARVYGGLDPVRRAKAVVFAGNWGEAGALDFYGPRYGLPGAVSASGSYWFFGPGPRRGDVLVSIGVDEESLRREYDRVTPAWRLTNPWTVEEESDLTVYISEEPKRTLQDIWPGLAGRN